MNLIKIKVNEEDRITLSSMFDNAIYNARQEMMDSETIKRAHWYKELEKKFKELRQRVVFEELGE